MLNSSRGFLNDPESIASFDTPPELMYNAVNISRLVPLEWALPLYGYVMPLLVVITTVTNCFIVLVLSQKHLRTPTNGVLLAMAITDLLTGWTSIPWFLYYYTLGGYRVDNMYGMDSFWCYAHKYLADIIPSVLHTTAIWLTVFLAVQRYVYVCVPNSVHLYCTPRTTKFAIILIFLLSFVTVLPEVLAKQFSLTRILDPMNNHWRRVCRFVYLRWVWVIGGVDVFYSVYFWVRAIMHFIPCTLLLVFTYKLGKTIKKAEIRKRSFVLSQEVPDRKASTVSINLVTSCSGRSLYATNRMLSVICSVFLVLEIPASVGLVLTFLIGSGSVSNMRKEFLVELLNRIMILRNLLIVLTSPIQFTIYCSMSEQFRLTVRQLFTKRLLFVAQAQATFHGGKRYSLILVDVDSIEARRNGGSKRNSRAIVSVEPKDPSTIGEYPEVPYEEKRKVGRVGRQVSFKDRPIPKITEITTTNGKEKNALRRDSPLTVRRLSTVIQEPPESPDTKITCILSDRVSLLSEPTLSTVLSDKVNGESLETRNVLGVEIELKGCSFSNPQDDDDSDQIDI